MEKYKNLDLYGWDYAVELLKQNGFLFVSVRDNSIPNSGSPTKPIEYLATNENRKGNKGSIEVLKVIVHRNGRVTLKTNLGFVQFFK